MKKQCGGLGAVRPRDAGRELEDVLAQRRRELYGSKPPSRSRLSVVTLSGLGFGFADGAGAFRVGAFVAPPPTTGTLSVGSSERFVLSSFLMSIEVLSDESLAQRHTLLPAASTSSRPAEP